MKYLIKGEAVIWAYNLIKKLILFLAQHPDSKRHSKKYKKGPMCRSIVSRYKIRKDTRKSSIKGEKIFKVRIFLVKCSSSFKIY